MTNKNLVVGVIVVLVIIAAVAVLQWFVKSSVPVWKKSSMLGSPHGRCPCPRVPLGNPEPGKVDRGDVIMITYPRGKAADAASLLCDFVGSECGGISYSTLDDTKSLVFAKGSEGTKPILNTKIPGWRTELAM